MGIVNSRIGHVKLDRESTERELSSFIEKKDIGENGSSIYKQLLVGEEPIRDWDIEKPFEGVASNLLLQKLSLWKQELEDLKLFKEKSADYELASRNQKAAKDVNDHLKQSFDETIRNVLRAGFFLPQLGQYRSEYDLEVKIRDYITLLDRESFLENYPNIKWEEMQTFAGTNLDLAALQIQINLLGTLNSSSGFLDKAVRDIETARARLWAKFKEIRTAQDTNASPAIPLDECPLCGSKEWEEAKNLDEALQLKQESLVLLVGDIGKEINDLLKEIFQVYVEPLLEALRLKLPAAERRLLAEFRNELFLDEPKLKAISSYIEFCQRLQIDLSKFWNTRFNQALGSRVNELLSTFKTEVSSLAPNYDLELIQKVSPVASKFSFQNVRLLETITIESIGVKSSFLDSEFRLYAQELTKVLREKISNLNQKISQLEELGNKLESIATIYEKAIKDHEMEMIQDIEIPFYIYSGKILQDVQRGSGLFIDPGTKLDGAPTAVNRLRFLARPDAEHDAYNNLSSGQIAALVLSYLLTLNKKYGQEGLRTILIDDPIQTMDEINMASFVDLLRNEFPDHQIIISTHEPMFSTYIRFKFEEFGKRTQPLNLKDIRYFSTQN